VDYKNNRVEELNFSTLPTLNFATTAPGSTSSDSPQTVTMENLGNLPLTFPAIHTTGATNPTITSGFAIGGSSTCPQLVPFGSNGTLAVDATCTYEVSFSPTSAGLYNGTLNVQDEALNTLPSLTQSILLNGTGSGSVATATKLKSSLNPSTVGQSVTFTATVSATDGTSAPNAGTVQFSADGGAVGSPVTVSGGVATYATSTLTAATHSITAVYTPATGSSFTTSTATALSQVVNLITPTGTAIPSAWNFTTSDAVSVDVTLSGGSGNPAPTGWVNVCGQNGSCEGGSLVNGSVTANFPAGWSGWVTGLNYITVWYYPDTASAGLYVSSTTTNKALTYPYLKLEESVSTLISPAVTASPNPAIITPSQSTNVTVTVAGGSGNPTPTGTVYLNGSNFTTGNATLSNGSATIYIGAGKLAQGLNTLEAVYTADTASAAKYNNAIGSTTVTVSSNITPAVTVTLKGFAGRFTVLNAVPVKDCDWNVPIAPGPRWRLPPASAHPARQRT